LAEGEHISASLSGAARADSVTRTCIVQHVAPGYCDAAARCETDAVHPRGVCLCIREVPGSLHGQAQAVGCSSAAIVRGGRPLRVPASGLGGGRMRSVHAHAPRRSHRPGRDDECCRAVLSACQRHACSKGDAITQRCDCVTETRTLESGVAFLFCFPSSCILSLSVSCLFCFLSLLGLHNKMVGVGWPPRLWVFDLGGRGVVLVLGRSSS
jgi:hypothetical protein